MASDGQDPLPGADDTFKDAMKSYTFDFQWSSFKINILDTATPQAPPAYLGDLKLLAWRPKIHLLSGSDGSEIAKGTLNNVHINTQLELRGKEIVLEAAKRFTTHYIYPSTTLSKTGKPQTMTWVTTCTAKYWHFHLLDDQKTPVARYSVDWWALKRYAKLEILSPWAGNQDAVEEIMATAMTVYACMLYRSNNIFALFGAAFHRLPDQKEVSDEELRSAVKKDWEIQQREAQSEHELVPMLKDQATTSGASFR